MTRRCRNRNGMSVPPRAGPRRGVPPWGCSDQGCSDQGCSDQDCSDQDCSDLGCSAQGCCALRRFRLGAVPRPGCCLLVLFRLGVRCRGVRCRGMFRGELFRVDPGPADGPDTASDRAQAPPDRIRDRICSWIRHSTRGRTGEPGAGPRQRGRIGASIRDQTRPGSGFAAAVLLHRTAAPCRVPRDGLATGTFRAVISGPRSGRRPWVALGRPISYHPARHARPRKD